MFPINKTKSGEKKNINKLILDRFIEVIRHNARCNGNSFSNTEWQIKEELCRSVVFCNYLTVIDKKTF